MSVEGKSRNVGGKCACVCEREKDCEQIICYKDAARSITSHQNEYRSPKCTLGLVGSPAAGIDFSAPRGLPP